MSSAVKMHMFHLPILRVGRYNPKPEYLFLKRFFDFIIACAAAMILSPIMAVTSIAIKIYDGGPVLYRQKRLTQNGRVFELYKFRSMRVDAEANGVARLSSREYDSIITPIGHFIR